MKLVIFGLSISSSWGNGHATLWRGLCAALARRGHRVIFFEKDVPYYAAHRDFHEIPNGELILYSDWADVDARARSHLRDADVAMVTSYCADALVATEEVVAGNALRVFYDLDAGVTLARLRSGLPVDYVGPRGLRDFDLTLSFTGGATLAALKEELGAVRVAPLYGSVDPAVHYPVPPAERYRADLSYLGTYAADRQDALTRLFVEPARRAPDRRFIIGGSQYDAHFPWLPNIHYLSHVPSAEHPAFYCSSCLTLNVTRRAMAEMGYCPSARLFEAAACETVVLSDYWDGLEAFFEPNAQILIAETTEDTLAALDRSPEELQRIARGARERTLAEHTADVRARQLENILESAPPVRDRAATGGTGYRG